MPNVFTYGSLMFSQVWTSVVRGSYTHSGATLPGYVRKSVFDVDYPVIYPAHGSVVQGVVYFRVVPEDIVRLDRFEGVYYQRDTVEIHLDDGTTTKAEAFILKDDYRHIATDREWDPKIFKKDGLVRFIKSYIGFDRT